MGNRQGSEPAPAFLTIPPSYFVFFSAVLPTPSSKSPHSNLDSHKELIPVVLVSCLPWPLKFNFVPQNGVSYREREKKHELGFERD